MGIIASIIIGGIAGWLATKIMNKNSGGLILNIILGIIGGFVGSLVFGLIGFTATNIIGQIIVGVVGACILIALVNALKKK